MVEALDKDAAAAAAVRPGARGRGAARLGVVAGGALRRRRAAPREDRRPAEGLHEGDGRRVARAAGDREGPRQEGQAEAVEGADGHGEARPGVELVRVPRRVAAVAPPAIGARRAGAAAGARAPHGPGAAARALPSAAGSGLPRSSRGCPVGRADGRAP